MALPPGRARTRDQAATEGVCRYGEHDRDEQRRLLGREDRGTRRDNDIDLEPDQLGRDFDKALAASLRPSILDRDGATLDPTELAQSLHKRRDPLTYGCRRGRAQESDGRQLRRRLRMCRDRPRDCAQENDEITASQFIGFAVEPRHAQCASSQLLAACASTASGTESESAGIGASSITLLDHRPRPLDLVVRHLEHQFVVHLQQHPRSKPVLRQRRIHAHHRAPDDIGGGALQPRIDGGALVERADRGIGAPDLGIVTLAAEQGQHVAVLLGERLALLHVIADAGKALEVFPDIGGGLLAGDAELVGEAEGGDAVDDAEVDRLGAATNLAPACP